METNIHANLSNITAITSIMIGLFDFVFLCLCNAYKPWTKNVKLCFIQENMHNQSICMFYVNKKNVSVLHATKNIPFQCNFNALKVCPGSSRHLPDHAEVIIRADRF